MWCNILKISLIFWACSVALADQTGTNSSSKNETRTYYFSKNELNWNDADTKCRSLGGFLASFDGNFTQRLVSNYMVYMNLSLNQHYYWVAGKNSSGNFTWHGRDTPAEFVEWGSNQPDNSKEKEHCLHLRYDFAKRLYEMNDWNCEQKANYICETNNTLTYKNVEDFPTAFTFVYINGFILPDGHYPNPEGEKINRCGEHYSYPE